MNSATKWIIAIIISAIIGFIVSYYSHSPDEITVIKKEYITLRDTVNIEFEKPIFVIRKIPGKQIDVDSLYRVALENAKEQLQKDTTENGINIYTAQVDTVLSDSLSKIDIIATIKSRLVLDPELKVGMYIKKEIRIPTIYYEQQIPFYKEKTFLPAIGIIGLLTTIIILR